MQKRKHGVAAATIEKLINRARYASVLNISVPLIQTAQTYGGSINWAYKLCKALEEERRILPIEVYGNMGNRVGLHEKFYQLAGNKKEHDRVSRIHARQIPHQSALVDVCLGFLSLYPQYESFVEYSPDLGVKYTPDARITLIDENGAKKYFYIELERSRSFQALKEDKIDKVEAILPKSNIEKSAKILIVYTHEEYNVYQRPVEYKDNPDSISYVRGKFEKLMKVVKGCPDRYLFMPFHDFYKLNETVWYNSKGDRTKLI